MQKEKKIILLIRQSGKKNENGELLLFSIAFAKINSTDLKLQISLLLFLIAGSVFLERDLNLHNTFGQIFDNLNKNENYLNGTRVDFNIQYAELDQFDAYQKACMEMTYRYIVINILFRISTYLFYQSKSAE